MHYFVLWTAYFETGEDGIDVNAVMEEAQGLVDAASADVLSPDQLNITLVTEGFMCENHRSLGEHPLGLGLSFTVSIDSC